MMNARAFCGRYYWVLVILFYVLGSLWLSLRAWDYLHAPVVLDYFWNESLHMYEPINGLGRLEWLNALLLPLVVVREWWYSPWWFIPIYACCTLWVCWQLWYRMQVDV